MPSFDGGDRSAGRWLTSTGRSYVIVRNIQAQRYQGMVLSSSGDAQVYERMLCDRLGDPEDYSGVGLHTHGDDNSYLECTS